MHPPTDPPLLAPAGLSYPAQNFYVPWQAYEPYGVHFALDSASQAQPQGGQLTTGQSYILQSLDPSPAPRSHERNGTVSTSDSQDIPAIPMGPPTRPRKRKAPTLRADAWEPYKARIIELHITQKLPLRKVKEIVKEESGFTAE